MGWRSFFGLGGEVPAPPPRKRLADALVAAHYRHIHPHLQRYRAADEPHEYLSLSDPRHFPRFASLACRDTAQVVLAQVSALYAAAAGDHRPALQHLRPDAVAAGEVEAELAPCFANFGRTLEAYAAVHGEFCRLLGHAPAAAFETSFRAASRLGDIGASFGPLGIIAGSLLGGVLANRQTQAAVEAGCARYNQAFAALMEAWDDACEQLGMRAIEMLAAYSADLEAALSPARNGNGQGFSRALPYREDPS